MARQRSPGLRERSRVDQSPRQRTNAGTLCLASEFILRAGRQDRAGRIHDRIMTLLLLIIILILLFGGGGGYYGYRRGYYRGGGHSLIWLIVLIVILVVLFGHPGVHV